MKIGDAFKTLKEFIVDWWALFAALAGAGLLLYGLYDPLDKHFEKWVTAHAHVAGAQAAVDDRVHMLITIALLAGIFLLVGMVSTWITFARLRKRDALAALEKERLSRQTAAEKDLLGRTFDQTIAAADNISRAMFPSTGQPVRQIISRKQIYTIYENGDCYFTEILVIDAAIRDLHFTEAMIEGDPECDPAEYPENIKLKITPEDRVKYLITENKPRRKGFAIFLLPVIRLGANDRRTVHTEYHWKGLLKKLMAGQEEFEPELRSAGTVAEVEYQFWLKPGLGKLLCDNVGAKLPPGDETLTEESDGKGMTGWVYKAKNVPGMHALKLNLRIARG